MTAATSTVATGPAELTYAEHLAALARAFHAVARAEQPLPGIELDLALSARRAVLDLLQTVHGDLTGIGPRPAAGHLDDVEAHPVAALGWALRRHPRPPGALAPTDVALARPVSPAGRAWQQVARHALLAQHTWSTGLDDGPIDQARLWAGVADVAALADTLTRLDLTLIRAAQAEPGRGRIAAALSSGLASHLGLAARETARVAASGPLPEAGPNRIPAPPGPTRTVMPVRHPSELPQAQRHLTVLLEAARGIRPERFRQLATVQARACLLLSTQLTGPDGHTAGVPAALPTEPSADRQIALAGLVDRLTEHARLLQRATERPGSIVGIEPGDGRPLRQAAETFRALAARPAAVASDPALLSRFTIALADTTIALATAADRGMARGAWQVPDHSESLTAPGWRTHRPGEPRPAALVAIHQAADHANVLTEAAHAVHPHPGANHHRSGSRSTTVTDLAFQTPPRPAVTWRPELTAALAGRRPGSLAVRPPLPNHPVLTGHRPRRCR